MSIPAEITAAKTAAAEDERRRIVGLVLAEYAHYKLAGHLAIADALDSLATQIERLSAS